MCVRRPGADEERRNHLGRHLVHAGGVPARAVVLVHGQRTDALHRFTRRAGTQLETMAHHATLHPPGVMASADTIAPTLSSENTGSISANGQTTRVNTFCSWLRHQRSTACPLSNGVWPSVSHKPVRRPLSIKASARPMLMASVPPSTCPVSPRYSPRRPGQRLRK